MKRFLTLLLCVALIAILPISLAFAGCKDKPKKIKLAEVTHSIFYAPLYVAINNGYFEEEGITIELTNSGGADKVMVALTAGSADIGLMGPEATIYVNREGMKDHPVVFGQLTKRDGSFLVGKVDEPNFQWTNLANKRVLIGRRDGMPAMTFQYIANKYNLFHDQNINLDTTVAFNMQGPVFEADATVDYTTLFEPLASEMQAAGKGYIVASVGQESGEVPYTAFSAKKSYIEKNKEMLKGFLRALMKGYEFIKTSSLDDIANSLEKSFPSTPKITIKFAMKNYIDNDTWCETPVMKEAAFERLQDIMMNAGALTEKVQFSEIVDNSLANEVSL